MSLAVFHSSTTTAFLKNTSSALKMQESVDPSFYLYVEKLSLEKLRREERRAPSTSLKGAPFTVGFNKSTKDQSPSETKLKLAAAKSEDIRWRTFVKLSYQKAKICARLVKGTSQHRNSLKPGATPPSSIPGPSPVTPFCLYQNSKSAMSLCDISSSSSVEPDLTLAQQPQQQQQQQQQQQRRGRSRSDAFIVRPGHWRPDVNLFLSLSAPARIPSPVGLESSS